MPPDRRPDAAPAFQIWGRARYESDWHIITVWASRRRDLDSRWPRPFWPGVVITWSRSRIACGWDYAESLLREQMIAPATRETPVEMVQGKLHGPRIPTYSEILAHECGHTGQARRMGLAYWPIGAAFTLFREGDRWVHWFENEATSTGQFGGVVSGSVHEWFRAQGLTGFDAPDS